MSNGGHRKRRGAAGPLARYRFAASPGGRRGNSLTFGATLVFCLVVFVSPRAARIGKRHKGKRTNQANERQTKADGRRYVDPCRRGRGRDYSDTFLSPPFLLGRQRRDGTTNETKATDRRTLSHRHRTLLAPQCAAAAATVSLVCLHFFLSPPVL